MSTTCFYGEKKNVNIFRLKKKTTKNALSGAMVKFLKSPGPSCSKLTTSLVNDSLKFTSSDAQIC